MVSSFVLRMVRQGNSWRHQSVPCVGRGKDGRNQKLWMVVAGAVRHQTFGCARRRRVRANLATLPPKKSSTQASAPSRFEALLQQFVRISSEDTQRRDVELTRTLAAIDLRAAEAALLARDPASYAAAIARARASIAGAFDGSAEPVRTDLAELEKLGSAPLAPALPELGSALRELRNLRATRALTAPRQAPPPAGAGT